MLIKKYTEKMSSCFYIKKVTLFSMKVSDWYLPKMNIYKAHLKFTLLGSRDDNTVIGSNTHKCNLFL